MVHLKAVCQFNEFLFFDFASIEIRELESKLRSAYVAKEQLAQMAEKRALAYDLMVSKMLLFYFSQDDTLSLIIFHKRHMN